MQCYRISIVLLIYSATIYGNRHRKCCPPGQHVIDKNSTLICDTNPDKRVQSTFADNNYVKGNRTGTCIEVNEYNNTSIYSVDADRKILKQENISIKFFPKCCHLEHLYDPTLHSCRKTETPSLFTGLLIPDLFFQIGLPHCKIISDVVLNSLEKLKWSAESVYFTDKNETISAGNFCMDSALDSRFVVRVCHDDFRICEKVRCIHKCCQDGQSFVNGSKCKDTFRYGIDLHSSKHIEDPDAPFAIIHGIQKPIHILNESKNFNIDQEGVFSIYIQSSHSFDYHAVTQESYCMDYAYKKGKVDGYTVFSRMITHNLALKFVVTRWVKLLSCVFLLMTIFIYVILPKLRNLFGKILLSYCTATLLLFLFLSVSQFFSADFGDGLCKAMGSLSVLASLWSFTWMQIMCIDIWFSFGTPRTLSGPLQRKEMKRLLQYSLYGWGFPLVWVLLIIFFNQTSILPEALHPYLGTRKCYMENNEVRPGNHAYIFFVILPILIQQIINIILFVKTITYCLRIRAEIERMNDSGIKKDYNAGKENLNLILKLAVIMGVSFIFETVSSIYSFNTNSVTIYIEVVWDTINCLQGVFIFIIFICKKKIWDDLSQKIISSKSSQRLSISKRYDLQLNDTQTEQMSLDPVA